MSPSPCPRVPVSPCSFVPVPLSPCPHPPVPVPVPVSPQIRLLRGPLAFGAVGLCRRLGDEDSLGSSDEELPPPFALPRGDLGDLGDMGDSSDSDAEGAPPAP